MTTTIVNIHSTPMAPYVGILSSLSKRDRQIVIEYLQQTSPAEEDHPMETIDDIALAVRAKFNVPESPETQWFKKHPITLSNDELSDERTQHILGK